MSKNPSHELICNAVTNCIGDLLRATDLPIEFRTHQKEAFQQLLVWLREPVKARGHRCYITHATGMGKTLHFLALAVEATYSDLRTVIVVPNRTLLMQTAREIWLYTGGTVSVGHVSSLPKKIVDYKDPSVVYATKGTKFAQIVLVVQNSFATYAKQLAKDFAPHIVIRDEMHWSYTPAQLGALKCFPRAMIVGYSATPDYLTTTARNHYTPVELDNGVTLYADPQRLAMTHFGRCIHHVGLREGIERGVLAPLAWGEIDLSSISLDGVPMSDGEFGRDYDPKVLAAHMEKHWHLVLQVIERLYETNEYNIRNRQVAAACPSVKTAHEFAAMVSKYTKAAVVVGSTNPTERQRLLDLFDADEDNASEEVIHALSSVYVLREGWDSRNAEILFFLRATKSRVLYEQYLGRILRKRRDGKLKVALVIDPRYQQNTFAPLSAPMLYGKPGEKITRGGLLMGPRGPKKKIVSPFLPKGVQVKITIKPVEIEYWAGEDGFFDADEEKWGTINAFARKFQLSYEAIESRIVHCKFRIGKDASGKQGNFYSFTDVKKACKDLLNKKLLQTGADGTAKKDGKTLATVRKLTMMLGLSNGTITAKIELAKCESYLGKVGLTGRLVDLYVVTDVKKACKDLLNKKLLQTGADGTAKKDGKTLATVQVLAKMFGLSEDAVKSRISLCSSYEGKVGANGRLVTLYYLTDVKKACKDLLNKELLQTGADGTAKKDGKTLATVRKLTKMLGISKYLISSRIKVAKCKSWPGKTSGKLVDLYIVADVRKACGDILTSNK